jgi:diguanylate cyclase (GGDEF)-like protein
VISHEEVQRIRDQLLELLSEDAHNTQRLLARLESISRESGIGAHSALILILTHLGFEEEEAKRHWKAVMGHMEAMARALGRDIGVRVALLDYFTNVNRHLTQPTLIDLEMFEASERSSAVDAMTGLVNDRAFRSTIQQEMRRAKRYEQKVSVVLFDMDDFQACNALHGEIVGDRLLREAGILLKNKIRDIDIAARPGEDEIALILPETDRNGALLVAERYRREFESYFSRREIEEKPVCLTISGGLASYPEDALSPEMLLERAAQALYRAKASGKNVVHVYHPERRRFLRFELEAGRYEVEVLAPRELAPGRARNFSRNGIVFTCPEPLDVGEEIEIRLMEHAVGDSRDPLCARGRVVRLEELPEADPSEHEIPETVDRFEVGVAFDLSTTSTEGDLLEFLERAHPGSPEHT